jgi:uncharacterized protein HemX
VSSRNTTREGEKKHESLPATLIPSARAAPPPPPDRDRGEVSATTVVLAAALIALALSVGVIVSGKVRDKATNLDLG